jgi:hypothetical protein
VKQEEKGTMTKQSHIRRNVLAGGLVAVFIGGTAMGDVFYRNEISGDLLLGDEELESFSTVANWDGSEYDWDFSGDLIMGSADIDIRQVSVRFNFSLEAGASVNFSHDEFFGWVFTDVNDTMNDFGSVGVTGRGMDVDWGAIDAGVLNADQFYVDLGSMNADDFISNGDYMRLTMSFVPAPAGALALLGVGLGLGGRRRRA